jgi:hypothetical protein
MSDIKAQQSHSDSENNTHIEQHEAPVHPVSNSDRKEPTSDVKQTGGSTAQPASANDVSKKNTLTVFRVLGFAIEVIRYLALICLLLTWASVSLETNPATGPVMKALSSSSRLCGWSPWSCLLTDTATLFKFVGWADAEYGIMQFKSSQKAVDAFDLVDRFCNQTDLNHFERYRLRSNFYNIYRPKSGVPFALLARLEYFCVDSWFDGELELLRRHEHVRCLKVAAHLDPNDLNLPTVSNTPCSSKAENGTKFHVYCQVLLSEDQ